MIYIYIELIEHDLECLCLILGSINIKLKILWAKCYVNQNTVRDHYTSLSYSVLKDLVLEFQEWIGVVGMKF